VSSANELITIGPRANDQNGLKFFENHIVVLCERPPVYPIVSIILYTLTI